jgi:cob(I)alamin adenosyltransferase
MVTLNRIYTKTGDDGSTGLVGGQRIKKASMKVSAYGDLDELNAHLGVCYTLASQVDAKRIEDVLMVIQNELFDIGAELATPAGSEWPGMVRSSQEQVLQLEQWIDELNANLPGLTSFILPGGTSLNAHLHVARTVCRRAERAILALHETEPVSRNILCYINRLSDLLFVLARVAMVDSGKPEYLWVPGAHRPQARQKP